MWNQIVSYLEEKVATEDLDLWLKETKLKSLENNILEIAVPNHFFQEWIEDNCLTHIQDFYEKKETKNVKVKFTINKKKSTEDKFTPQSLPSELTEKSFRKTKNLYLFNKKYTFDTFVVGKNNRFAQAACEAVAKEPGTAYNPLFIYGGVGLGKTHLLHAIGNYVKAINPKSKVLYITADKFMNELIEAIRHDKNIEFRQKYRTLDVLLIDDIQFLSGKESTQEEFFHTFNTLYESHKQIVLSSDCTPKEIPTLEERLRSRFEWGVIADVQAPDFETRVAILRRKAEMDNINASEDVINFIATKVKANIRKLEGSLIRVAAFSELTSVGINIDSTREVLKDIVKDEPITQAISIDLIQEITGRYFNVDKADILSKKRNDSIVLPRQVAIYITREITTLSITEIGRKFGGRDHTTVMYACGKIKKKIQEDPYFSALVNKVINEIKNHL
ncbi:MAG: chromosomal replication initiator protein DnaA [bacterium]|nr:chromosomal replication initiator protein DnaA [bacterium]